MKRLGSAKGPHSPTLNPEPRTLAEEGLEQTNCTSVLMNSSSATIADRDLPPDKKDIFPVSETPVFLSRSVDDNERPMRAEVTSKYVNVEFGLLKSREPGVRLEEGGSSRWHLVSVKKAAALLREEVNCFTYRSTIAEGDSSCALNGKIVLLHSSSIQMECCFRHAQTAREWFILQLNYARNGNVTTWGSHMATGDWVRKTWGWRRIMEGGKLQIATSIDGAPNIPPSSWSNFDPPTRYAVDALGENSITCIVGTGNSRPVKFCWNIQGRTIVFTSSDNKTGALVREECYPSEIEAGSVFRIVKAVLQKCREVEVTETMYCTPETTRQAAQGAPGKTTIAFPWFGRKHHPEIRHKQEANPRSWSNFKLKGTTVASAGAIRDITPGIRAFTRWMSDRTSSASENSGSVTDSHNAFSYRALQDVRSHNWNSAYANARRSIDIQESIMGYVAITLAQVGMNKSEEALQMFDFALANCDPQESKMLLLIKVVVLFIASKHDEAFARMDHLITLLSKDDSEIMYCCIQVLGQMYLMRGDYRRAVESLNRGKDLASSCTGRDLETISLIFGWTFNELLVTVQRCHCEALLTRHCVQEAAQLLLEIRKTLHGAESDWVMGLQKKCVDMLKVLGDEAFSSGRYSEAITQYSTALPLSPRNSVDILIKRGKARLANQSWEDALVDAKEVIKLDPSSYEAHEMRYMALHGTEHYDEAIESARVMFSLIEHSPEKELQELRNNYTTRLRDTRAAIDSALHAISKICPLVLIDLKTGRLCDAVERERIFKSDMPFQKLISEAVTKKTEPHPIVTNYFQWIMFSHTWEGTEPTLKDVNSVKSIWNLKSSPLNDKLRKFCETARDDGHRWVWSDTCCIDKETSAILNQSITSMYRWYAEGAATLVYLADVLPSSESGALTKSRWMTRAWTLQELLASRVIRFYDNTWKPYLNDMSTNHKESPGIKEELTRAMGVAPETITSFQPEDLGVWEKLRLASTRNATMDEDIAYSLIGIFSSNIVPCYGQGKRALGQLLEDIVARSEDITVIAWTGQPSHYNSALPLSLAVYSKIPCIPPPMKTAALEKLVGQVRSHLTRSEAVKFYRRVIQLHRATFLHRCLHLPCIVFPVEKIDQIPGDVACNLYRATVSFLGKVQFQTTADVKLSLSPQRKLIVVHPWLHGLCEPVYLIPDADELDVESKSGVLDAKPDSNCADRHDRTFASSFPSHTELLPEPDHYTQALRLIARLGRPFTALLLEQQSNGRYKRIAAEHEITVPGVPYETNFSNIRVKVLEII